jgi:hypothetical protein
LAAKLVGGRMGERKVGESGPVVLFPGDDDPILVAQGQRAEDHTVDHRERRDHRPGRDGKDRDGGRRERGGPAKPSEGRAQVARQVEHGMNIRSAAPDDNRVPAPPRPE